MEDNSDNHNSLFRSVSNEQLDELLQKLHTVDSRDRSNSTAPFFQQLVDYEKHIDPKPIINIAELLDLPDVTDDMAMQKKIPECEEKQNDDHLTQPEPKEEQKIEENPVSEEKKENVSLGDSSHSTDSEGGDRRSRSFSVSWWNDLKLELDEKTQS